ncbi:hypothetical protein L1987_14500 [Smallanthus sonchifolius]|uniref:Uncharacterized protein n=1 Tax=Smallanthus sonchifolius TaxID=185202 RepID=A0ACB9J2X2_9ASTR|nr:hypothetical protein L1987_14500 [Smallanthus sonchifolius]
MNSCQLPRLLRWSNVPSRMPKESQLDSMRIQKPATNGPYSINHSGVSAVEAFYELLSQSSLNVIKIHIKREYLQRYKNTHKKGTRFTSDS